MPTALRRALLAAALAGCAPQAVAPPPTTTPPRDDAPPATDDDACAPYEDDLQALADALDAQRGDHAAALAIVKGDCLFARGLGAQRDDGPPADERTRFQLASITKTLTAFAALSLEEDGVLDRATPVAELVATTSSATLEDLLAHRAGYPTEVPATSDDLAEGVAQAADAAMWAPPDEVWLYSNPGFAVAGQALVQASGVAFEDLVAARVFARAGMDDAVMGARVVDDDGFAHGRSAYGVVTPTSGYLSTTFYGPMGGAWASARDMARLMKAMIDGDLAAARADMGTSRGPAYGAAVGYGQGLFVAWDGTLFHSGSVAGYLSEMDVDVDDAFGVAVLWADDATFPYEVVYDALGRFTAPPPPPLEDVAPSDEQLLGAWRDDVVLGEVVVEQALGALQARFVDGEFTSTLQPLGPASWLFEYPPWGAEIDATFVVGPSGATYLVTPAGVATRPD